MRAAGLGVSLAAVLALAAPLPAGAHATSCATADSNLRAARAELLRAIDAYAACVAGSSGGDDCAAAFRKVLAVQSAFATAVADLHGSCPPE